MIYEEPNIFRAFERIMRIYEEVYDLMGYCKEMGNEKGEYLSQGLGIFKNQPEENVESWNIHSFSIIFQNKKDNLLKNGWRDKNIYVMEINLYNPQFYRSPIVNLAKYQYDNISNWTTDYCINHYRYIYEPLYNFDLYNIEYRQKGAFYIGNAKKEFYQELDKYLLGIRKIVGYEVPMQDIEISNVEQTVFKGFDSLKDF